LDLKYHQLVGVNVTRTILGEHALAYAGSVS